VRRRFDLAYAQGSAVNHEEGESSSEGCGSHSRAIGFLPRVIGSSPTTLRALQARFAAMGGACWPFLITVSRLQTEDHAPR
jgi:hypothetical protein